MEVGGKKVFVGLSGGVDSSVSAYLLKKAGYDVTGVFIKVWQPEFVACTWQEDRLDAMRVCAVLDIPFLTFDLEAEYKKEVIDEMLNEYKKGRTPNPDVLCNREVKFGAFLLWAKAQGADFIATGHYAQIYKQPTTDNLQLLKGKDSGKDQSYFLWTLTQEQLKQVLFPVGHLEKSEVRRIAKEAELPTAEKKDSQGLCFISNVDMKEFLKKFIKPRPGLVLDEAGATIGDHSGAEFLTLGERHGFNVNSKEVNRTPFYVVAKDIDKNTITVSHTPSLRSQSDTVFLEQKNFISGENPTPGKYEAETRYHGEVVPITLSYRGKTLAISPNAPLIATPGQSLVLYKGNECMGGGIIV